VRFSVDFSSVCGQARQNAKLSAELVRKLTPDEVLDELVLVLYEEKLLGVLDDGSGLLYELLTLAGKLGGIERCGG
jgi:hypothetical protein